MHAQPSRARRGRLVAAGCAALVLLGVAGFALTRSRGPKAPATTAAEAPASTRPAPAPPSADTPPATPTSTPTPDCDPWGCVQQRRLTAAAALVRTRPGQLGITVLDRRTGAVWTAGTAGHRMWASSTPKLAMAVSLLERARTGELTLDRTAHAQIDAMLAVSDDNAADALWDRFGGAAQVPGFRARYGMTGLGFVPGFPRRWGFLKCSSADLRRLLTYVLTRLDADDRDHVVAAMRQVGAIQRWGVWAAGAAQRPGTKNGWSVESDAGRQHWCTSSVGFAGPGERYVVAVMDDLPPGASIATGVHAVSDVVATVFGAKVPAVVTVPDASTGR